MASKNEPSHAPLPADLPPATAELADALLALRDRDEMLRFLRDLCTLPELEALGHRWQIVNLLEQNEPYLAIAERVGASTTTVTRSRSPSRRRTHRPSRTSSAGATVKAACVIVLAC